MTRALVVALALALAASQAEAQCALCRETLGKGGDSGLVRGFYISILMLLSAPVLLFGTIGGLLYRAHRKKLAAITEETPCATRT